jgi:hypothetical protein
MDQSPNSKTFEEPRNRFRQAGNRFPDSLKGLRSEVANSYHFDEDPLISINVKSWILNPAFNCRLLLSTHTTFLPN